MPRYAELIYNGFWFSPERRMLQALIDESQNSVTGRVRLKLYKGNVSVIGRESPNSLYSQKVVTFEEDQGAYDQFDAQGFIKLNALRLRLGAMAGRRGGDVTLSKDRMSNSIMRRRDLIAAALASSMVPAARAAPKSVVLELFTSQGCSSCPPADALLGLLARRSDVIALAWHVDYWDRLGWHDRFGSRDATLVSRPTRGSSAVTCSRRHSWWTAKLSSWAQTGRR